MEDLIKQFMAAEPPISGDGTGSGYGYGDGDGSGYGSGDGTGSGSSSGYGSGSGSGSGYGSGSGSGYGDGDGSGSGDGTGSGSGSGDGTGSGSGSGYGDGYGYGSGYGDGYGYGYGDVKKPVLTEYKKGFLNKHIASLKSFKNKPVYYIDDIPCIFLSIIDNMAKVEVINNDFTTKKMYIAKSGYLFAHGESKEDALQSVNDKYYASLSFEEKKAEFLIKFKKSEKYSNRLFFDWHHFLTGSCESGRLRFVESNGINLDGEMTTSEFLNLTKNEYNNQVIKEILEQIK